MNTSERAAVAEWVRRAAFKTKEVEQGAKKDKRKKKRQEPVLKWSKKNTQAKPFFAPRAIPHKIVLHTTMQERKGGPKIMKTKNSKNFSKCQE